MEQSSNQNAPIALLQIGGMDERSSLSTAPQSAFQIVEGLFPNKANAQQRIYGKSLLQKFSSEIRGIYQTFDAAGTIIIQTRDAVITTTVDELFNRVPIVNLYLSTGDNLEETMAYALIVHKATAGTDGGIIASANSTFGKRTLTDKLADASSFVSFSASPTSRFTLAAGTYRFTIHVAGCNCGTHQAKLRNITDSTDDLVGSMAATGNTGAGVNTNTQTNSIIEGRLTLSGTKVFEIHHAATQNANTSTASGQSVSSFGLNVYYLICKILKE